MANKYSAGTFKKICNISLVILLIMALVGCSFTDNASQNTGDQSAAAEQSGKNVSLTQAAKLSDGTYTSIISSDGDNTVIRDCIGREVKVPSEPDSIAALDSFAAEAMVMTGTGKKMSAAPNGAKSDRLLCQICPDISNVSVPMSGGTFNAESLINIAPDLILIKQALYESGSERAKLDKLGIPYLVIGYGSMDEQMYALQVVGDAAGSAFGKNAAAINTYYQGVIKKAKKIAASIPKAERVRVYHSINEVLRTDGPDTLGYDWITCTGAEDVSASEKLTFSENDYFASAEQIFQWDPDVVICNEADTADYLKSDQKWTGLRAVYQQKIYNIPVGATRWGQRGSLETYFAILWLGKTIYPQYYADVDLKKEVQSFYKTYLGIDVDDATYDQILSGKGIRNASSQQAGK